MSEDFKYRKSRCADCGFTKDTDANKSGVTEIKANLCAEIPEPFYCHFNAKENELPEDAAVLCQGWVERCNELDATGFYANQPDWQRELKSTIVETISEIERDANLSDDEMLVLMDTRIKEFLSK